jgi:hypothetical protein
MMQAIEKKKKLILDHMQILNIKVWRHSKSYKILIQQKFGLKHDASNLN